MGSLGEEYAAKKKAMWLYPKVSRFNPTERWGHSACYLDGVVYVFGGCCGGLHFSDVLKLDLDTMTWSVLSTTGQQPGTRDSHSAVLVGHKMMVIGGTTGTKKVNDVHMLDLRTKEWSRPHCIGNPPSPRESHTATVVGHEKVVVFGGSGEGGGNYLNDVHILDLKTMSWSSPEVKGDVPAPRDSHAAVAIGSKLFVYGGDCGDRYYGEVDVFDLGTLTWTRLAVQGSTPGARAGHAAIGIGSKVCVIGGVGDKHYYNDVWILDINTCSWHQLDVCGRQPQGRFSHTAVATDTHHITIYGGCGEDERPLNELLVLKLMALEQQPGSDGRYDMSMCKVFGNRWSEFKHKVIKNSAILRKGEPNRGGHGVEAQPKQSQLCSLDESRRKRRKACDVKTVDLESEQEEHSLSLSQNSSPSHSDQEQSNIHRMSSLRSNTILPSQCCCGTCKSRHDQLNRKLGGDQAERHSRPLKTEQFLHVMQPSRQELQFLAVDHQKKAQNRPSAMMGAEVRGVVDGAFDAGYLMTANVNGQLFRGVLFPPGPAVNVSRPATLPRSPSSPLVLARSPPTCNALHQALPIHARPLHQYILSGSGHATRQSGPAPGAKPQPSTLSGDLQGVVLTLGGPGGADC